MRTCFWLCLAMGWCAADGQAVDWKAYRPQGCVSDFAGVIDPGSKSQLEEYCGSVEHATGIRIVLVTLPSLEGEPVEAVARALFEAWRDPHKPGDRRIMLLLATGDRLPWAVAGGGAGPAASGIQGRIFREIRPALRRQDYNEALRAAAETIGEAAARASHVKLAASLPRRLRWSLWEAMPWPVVIGGVVILAWLMWAGAPAGYGGFGGRGLLPGLIRRSAMRRSTWGSRGSGGFGGYDSGDTFGGFGGGACNDW
ncbi:MAG TPA: TPM domain-containing protein [Bryobacteraceae bacterium]|nr:TPM domain-containing protein [Bryobacteraceae bacterium]